MKGLWIILLALLLGASILAQESSTRTAEIIRKKNNKKVVAQVKSDEGVFYIDYGDIIIGKGLRLAGEGFFPLALEPDRPGQAGLAGFVVVLKNATKGFALALVDLYATRSGPAGEGKG